MKAKLRDSAAKSAQVWKEVFKVASLDGAAHIDTDVLVGHLLREAEAEEKQRSKDTV